MVEKVVVVVTADRAMDGVLGEVIKCRSSFLFQRGIKRRRGFPGFRRGAEKCNTTQKQPTTLVFRAQA